jgi:hypothetical protein
MVCTDRPGNTPAGNSVSATAGADHPSSGDPLGPLLSTRGRPEPRNNLRALRFACWGAALLLGAFDAWYPRFSMSTIGPFADGVAYIDIAMAYVRGDWTHALNAYWSPLYSWLLALALGVLRPSAYAEFPVVHLVNLLIFVAALGCFDYLWRAWMEDHRARTAAGPTGWISLPPWALLAIGYALFTWSAISLISVQLMSPDLLVAGLIYLAAGLTLHLRRGDPRPRAAARLGAVLGLGYLAKGVMLPLACVFLLVAFLPVRHPRRAGRCLLAAGIALLIVTAPFVYGLSRQKGRLTFGDTGRLNYASFVNGASQLDWQGETPGHGTPKHPTRLIYPAPPVYEFAGPIGGTYPVWTDPSYWNEGVRARFNWRQQARTLRKNLTAGRRQRPRIRPYGLVAGMLFLLLTDALVAKRRWPALVRWDLLLLSLAPAVLYALVVVQTRYLGASVVLFCLALLPAIRLPAHKASKAMVVLATGLILLIPAYGLARTATRDIGRRNASRVDWNTAAGLWALGIHGGDRVGCIGLSWDIDWARLARVSVVAHVPSQRVGEYWGASPAVRTAVLGAFAKVGVRAVVTGQRPAPGAANGWHRLGGTDRYVRLLGPPTPSSLAQASHRLLASPPARQHSS